MLTNFFKVEIQKSDFAQRMEELLTFLKDKRVILFGFGDELIELYETYNFKNLNILGFSDNNDIADDFRFSDKFIQPEKIREIDFDYILITQDNLQRKEKYLFEELNIDKTKVINVLRCELFDEKIHIEYLKKYNFISHFRKLSKKLKGKKVIIYGANPFLTAINKLVDLSELNIIAICDMKFKMTKEKENLKFLNFNICSTSKIKTYNPDIILVAEKYFSYEIMELLYFSSLKNTTIKVLPIFQQNIYHHVLNYKLPFGKEIGFSVKIKRIFNLLFNSVTSKMFYNTYTLYKIPSSVRLDTCTLCQLNCKSCYMRKYNHDAVGDGFLKFENFKNFVDKNPNIKGISISNSGEIFLNPDLSDILKYSFEHNITLDANTGVNLNTLSDGVAEDLVRYKFTNLIVSLDGASQETYIQYRQKGDFDKVIKNIKKINFYKEKYNSDFPRIIWKFILFNHNEFEILKAKELAQELKTELVFALPWGDNTFTPKDSEFVKRETGIEFASVKEKESKTKRKRALGLCARCFTAPQINYDGNLLGCCILFKEHFGINIFEEGLENGLLSSMEFQYAIRMLRAELPPCDAIPCTSCNEYNSITYNNSYFIE